MKEIHAHFGSNEHSGLAVIALFLIFGLTKTEFALAQELDIGRLFTTPSERATLDKTRHNVAVNLNIHAPPPVEIEQKPPAPQAEAKSPPPPPPRPPIQFKGYITRGNVPVKIWAEEADGATLLNAGSDASGNPVFRIGSSATGVAIKPGQIFYPSSDLTQEAYLVRAPDATVPAAKSTELGNHPIERNIE